MESNIKTSTQKGVLIMKRPLEFALGLIGGMLGIILAFMLMLPSMLGKGEGYDVNYIISITVFSVIGIIGACIVVNGPHTKVAGWLMIISALGISATLVYSGVHLGGSILFLLPGILLIIAGIIAAFKKTRV